MFLAVHFCDLQLQCRALTEPAILVCKDKQILTNCDTFAIFRKQPIKNR